MVAGNVAKRQTVSYRGYYIQARNIKIDMLPNGSLWSIDQYGERQMYLHGSKGWEIIDSNKKRWKWWSVCCEIKSTTKAPLGKCWINETWRAGTSWPHCNTSIARWAMVKLFRLLRHAGDHNDDKIKDIWNNQWRPTCTIEVTDIHVAETNKMLKRWTNN